MTPGLIKMWISFVAMLLMVVAVFAIYLSRYKFRNKFLKILFALAAYSFMIIGGLIMLIIVFSGPTSD